MDNPHVDLVVASYADNTPLVAMWRVKRLRNLGWALTQNAAFAGLTWVHAVDGVAVLETMEWHGDRLWQHVSVSQRDQKVPSWDRMSEIKELFIGRDKWAYAVHPPHNQYVNIHPGVLHWYGTDTPALPDFRVRMDDGSIQL